MLVDPASLPGSGLLTRALQGASDPGTLPGLLEFILDSAIGLTGSSGGGLVIFDLASRDVALIGSALRGRLRDGSAVAEFWRRELRLGAVVGIASPDPFTDSRIEPLLVASRSILWTPLLDGKRMTGALHVESPQIQAYPERAATLLHELAAEAIPAIYRCLLKERMARVVFRGAAVGVSPAFLNLERQIRRATASPHSPILISGERGSGKELAAWAAHLWSERWQGPLVPVLASAFAKDLFTDELFGHEKHAFTGAERSRRGKFEAADGGTVFLDEVGDLSAAVQSALLRLIERGELSRVGRDLPLHIDVRILAATNRDLAALMAQGRFREDLYDRLSVFEIRVPPLRERREDIPLLTNHFIQQHCRVMQRLRSFAPLGVCAGCSGDVSQGCTTHSFYETLTAYDWPGNIRELEHLVIRLLATVPDEILDVQHLPPHIKSPRKQSSRDGSTTNLRLDAVIKEHIERVLEMTHHNQSRTATILGLPLSTLRDKMKKLGVEASKPAG